MGAGVSSLGARCACAAAVAAAGCCWMAARSLARRGSRADRALVVLTGCDSGLGFSLALRALARGAVVLAACLDERGPGAARLRQAGATVAPLDVTDGDSVQRLARRAADLVRDDPGLELIALVNNAGVMVFGEFEWQTERLIRHQVEVNLLGTMRVTKAFCPLIRQHKGRIVTVTSHCASQSLPGLAVYGATKAALEGWCDGLRVEQSKYGVKVITLVPGYFMMNSNLMARHHDHVAEMQQAMSAEDRGFFGDYFGRFHAALGVFAVRREPASIQDERLHRMFEAAVLSPAPAARYRNSPLRYSVYHWLFALAPTCVRDRLMERFMSMPEWHAA
ncbi:11-beta-hydroxysteroid dehydrogenase type 2 isoform X2 [Bacillus rossius redtenbacheri]|uniref:11-beta-hydroxysteroid dehydrogenase type 2 isoform X2 n=1 Tax=Bacillus rossius redtenbacheri TaxID=93214 RepID=UPI002FDDF3D8